MEIMMMEMTKPYSKNINKNVDLSRYSRFFIFLFCKSMSSLVAIIRARLITVLNVNTGNCDEEHSNHAITNVIGILLLQKEINNVCGSVIKSVLTEDTETDTMKHVVTEDSSESSHQGRRADYDEFVDKVSREQSNDTENDQEGGTFNVLIQRGSVKHTEDPETEHNTTIGGHSIHGPFPELVKHGTTQKSTNETDKPESPTRTSEMEEGFDLDEEVKEDATTNDKTGDTQEELEETTTHDSKE